MAMAERRSRRLNPDPSSGVPSGSSVELLSKLVSFDTTSRNSNLDLIDFAEDYLTDNGARTERVYDETGRKANLYASFGPDEPGGIILSGHTDVVPVDDQDWDSDPFDMTEQAGRLYGRGTTDMKGFVACMMALAPVLTARGLTTPVHLAMSYDEEVGCVGVRRLIDRLNTRAHKPALCIVGEPTEMKVVQAHKGKLSVRCTVHGRSAHSALAPQGVNAVEYAAELVSHIKAIARRLEADGPRDAKYDVPHSTAHTGVMRGGTILNIVPSQCVFDFEFRCIREDNAAALLDEVKARAAELEAEMTARDPAAGFKFETMTEFPGLDTADDEEVIRFALALAEQNDLHKVAYGTEGGLFSRQGAIPTVVCGPGSIEQAHIPNEFIALEQIAKCEAFLDRLADRVCAEAA